MGGQRQFQLDGHAVISESIDLLAYVGQKVAAEVVATAGHQSDPRPQALTVVRLWVISGDLGQKLGQNGSPYVAPPRPITIMVSGRALVLDAPAVVGNGRTLVPLRTLMEALGAQVSWDAARQAVTVRSGSKTALLFIGSNQVQVTDGSGVTQVVTIDAAPVIVGGRTEVPLRFLAETFGFRVDWDPDTYTVTVH